MNILFLCTFQATENASGGIARVTTNLCRVFTEKGHICNMAYFNAVTGQESELFHKSKKLEQGKEMTTLSSQFSNTDIVIVQVQMTKKNLYLLSVLDNFRKENGARLIYCHHNDPFSEAVGYDWQYLKWILFHAKDNISNRSVKALWCLYCILFPQAAIRRIAARRQSVADIMDQVVLLSDSFVPAYQKYVSAGGKGTACIGNCFTYSTAEYEEMAKENTILVVSNMNEHAKRITRILEAWKLIMEKTDTANWKLQLVGDGEDLEEYKKIVAKMKLRNCSFEGRQNPLPYYRKSKFLLMSSAYEGFGMVILEAQQMGCIPVVTDSWASVRDLISHGENGIITARCNLKSFAETVYGLMSDEERRKEMAGQCARMNSKFSEQAIYDKWQTLFKQLGK